MCTLTFGWMWITNSEIAVHPVGRTKRTAQNNSTTDFHARAVVFRGYSEALVELTASARSKDAPSSRKRRTTSMELESTAKKSGGCRCCNRREVLLIGRLCCFLMIKKTMCERPAGNRQQSIVPDEPNQSSFFQAIDWKLRSIGSVGPLSRHPNGVGTVQNGAGFLPQQEATCFRSLH